jgi:MOSC domain-containing protein YiiM
MTDRARTETLIQVQAVNVGKPTYLMDRHGAPIMSGIRKQRLPDGPVIVGETNILGDGQADLVSHGGPDKAVYAYPAEHLPLWREEIGYDGGDSSFGENLTIFGILEDEARIGDIWRWGAVLLQVSQPRWPCYKLAERSGHRDMVKRLVDSHRSGWYLRVLQAGETRTDAPIELVERDARELTVREAFVARINLATIDDVTRQRMVSHPALSVAWREGF